MWPELIGKTRNIGACSTVGKGRKTKSTFVATYLGDMDLPPWLLSMQSGLIFLLIHSLSHLEYPDEQNAKCREITVSVVTQGSDSEERSPTLEYWPCDLPVVQLNYKVLGLLICNLAQCQPHGKCYCNNIEETDYISTLCPVHCMEKNSQEIWVICDLVVNSSFLEGQPRGLGTASE